MATPTTIRKARPEEGPELTSLALRSKALWGYDESFLQACRGALTVTEEDLSGGIVGVLELAGEPAGFYRVGGKPPEGELCHLWVEPKYVRHGVGTLLLGHALTEARSQGFASLLVQSDPHAEEFYASRGAVRCGDRESAVAEGRFLPLLRFRLEEA